MKIFFLIVLFALSPNLVSSPKQHSRHESPNKVENPKAQSNNQAFDQRVQAVIKPYLALQKSFANDQFNGALVKAQEMLSVAKKLESVVLAGKRESDYRVIRSELLKEIAALTKAKGLADARESFKKLSRPLARWVGFAKPTNLQVVYCPMAKGSWLQAKGTAVANPYLTNMPKCGTIM